VVTFDPFHVIKLMNDKLAKIRADEARLFPAILKKSRYLFLKNLRTCQNPRDNVLDCHHRQPKPQKLGSVPAQAQSSERLLCREPNGGGNLLTRWHRKAAKSSIHLIRNMAETVKEHWNGILSHFESKLTSGFLEGINSLIQSAKPARGTGTWTT